ncbi:hypothetical protein EDC04DRAFT_3093126 [Pisolithus marmoratus]|nr:hypothetical protein EDC04DRAFT_3093126 [Pisolithus marmoratus]
MNLAANMSTMPTDAREREGRSEGIGNVLIHMFSSCKDALVVGCTNDFELQTTKSVLPLCMLRRPNSEYARSSLRAVVWTLEIVYAARHLLQSFLQHFFWNSRDSAEGVRQPYFLAYPLPLLIIEVNNLGVPDCVLEFWAALFIEAASIDPHPPQIVFQRLSAGVDYLLVSIRADPLNSEDFSCSVSLLFLVETRLDIDYGDNADESHCATDEKRLPRAQLQTLAGFRLDSTVDKPVNTRDEAASHVEQLTRKVALVTGVWQGVLNFIYTSVPINLPVPKIRGNGRIVNAMFRRLDTVQGFQRNTVRTMTLETMKHNDVNAIVRKIFEE